MSTMRYGGDWSPEQWPREVWRDDVALMQRAGVNLVTLGVFSWATLQPTADTFDFDWLDEVIELTTSAGIDVDLATPTASPPPWLGTADPEVRAVTDHGVRLAHGSRNHFCPSSPTYRDACRDIARRLGERYGARPGVVMWHVGNEYGQFCWCDRCEQGFRDWLQARHGSLDALNAAWGTAFWSQRYSDWAEIQLPRPAGYLVNPAQVLDHRRWASDLLRDCHRDQVEVLRPVVGGVPITTNFMGFFGGVDYFTWRDDVDVVADDHYANPDDPDAPARAALTHDLMRGIGRGRPWLMMEQAMGAVNWRTHNVPKTDVQRRHDVLRAVAHGADGVLSFQWRQSRSGSERFHSAMLPNSGPETRLHQQVRRIGAELARLTPVVGTPVSARVAIIHDWPSRWALEERSVASRERDPLRVLEAWHRPLWRAGIATDVVSVDDDLSTYDLVLAPALHATPQPVTEALRRHVEAGRALVLGPWGAAVDEFTGLLPGPFPGGLCDLLGARGEQWWPLGRAGVPVTSQWGGGTAHTWAEQLTVDDAEVLVRASHSDLDAQVVRRGGFTYVGCDLPDDLLAALLLEACERADVHPDHVVGREGTAGLEVATRGGATFVLNPTDQPRTCVLGAPVHDLLTGAHHASRITVGAGDAVVLVRSEA